MSSHLPLTGPIGPIPNPSGQPLFLHQSNEIKPGPSGLKEYHPTFCAPSTHALIVYVASEVRTALQEYNGGGSPEVQDALFLAHTGLVTQAIEQKVDRLIPVKLWHDQLAEVVQKTEQRLSTLIHKGAPYYNNGLCLFLLGDFDGAYIYFAKAADEDKRTRNTDPQQLLVGSHALSRQVLIDPLQGDLLQHWTTDYQTITGRVLNAAELIELLSWLAQRRSDAAQMILALHRFLRCTREKEENHALQLIRFRAIGEMLVVIESALRQNSYGTKQFHDRIAAALSSDTQASSAFSNLHRWFGTAFPNAPDRETANALNQILSKAETDFSNVKSQSEKAGIVAYVCVRVRNSLLHLNEENSDVFKNRVIAMKVAGWILATCCTIKHA